eukprot:5811665-Amphidinium_carterae.1
MSFAEAQSFARWSRFHRKALDEHANSAGSFALTPELLDGAPPGVVQVITDPEKLMLLTDGAVEILNKEATYAGILVDMKRGQAQYFSGQSPQRVDERLEKGRH